MCLYYVDSPKEYEMTGVGYKVVRKNDDGTYSPFFPYSSKDGHGCSFHPVDKKYYFKNKMVYRMNKPYMVKHKRIAMTVGGDAIYSAGVHLYLDYKSAIWNFHQRECYCRERIALIKCKYEKVVAIDRVYRIIVAKNITPIEEIMDSKMEM